jgi:hypothetical protein
MRISLLLGVNFAMFALALVIPRPQSVTKVVIETQTIVERQTYVLIPTSSIPRCRAPI